MADWARRAFKYFIKPVVQFALRFNKWLSAFSPLVACVCICSYRMLALWQWEHYISGMNSGNYYGYSPMHVYFLFLCL